MRKTFCILCLIAVTLLASASDVFAQRGGRGGGRGGGGRGGVGRGGFDRGFGRGGFYGDFGYYGGLGYYGGPYYYGDGGGYYYSPDYYANPPYYSSPVVQAPPTQTSQSFYYDPNSATITVQVPNPNAQVWFDDAPTSQRGMDRTFQTPALQQAGTYSIKARWTENGRTVDQQRQVRVQPGQAVLVNFQAPPSEALPSPQPPKK